MSEWQPEVGKVGLTTGEKAVANEPLDDEEKVALAAKIDRLDGLAGTRDAEEFATALAAFQTEFSTASSEERAAWLYAGTHVAQQWEKTQAKINPALTVLSAQPAQRAQELKTWIEANQ